MKRKTLQCMMLDKACQFRSVDLDLLGKLQQESTRLFSALVEEGKKVQAQRHESAKQPLLVLLHCLKGTLLEQAEELQRLIEAHVVRTLNRLDMPDCDELQLFSSRIGDLEHSVQKLAALEEPTQNTWRTFDKGPVDYEIADHGFARAGIEN